MRTTTGRALLPAALLAAALPTGSPAAQAESAWVLGAASSASAVVVLRRPVELTLVAGTPAYDAQVVRNTVVSHSGRWGGVVVRNASTRQVVWSVVALRDLPGAYVVDTSSDPGRQLLPAGTYRVDVVGDGRTTVRVPVRGPAPRPVTATRPVTGISSGTAVTTGSAPLRQLRVPFDSRAATPVLHVAHARTEAQLLAADSSCFVPPRGRTCATDAEDSSQSAAFAPGVGDRGSSTWWGVTTRLAAGAHEALLEGTGAPAPRSAVLFAAALPE